MTLNLGDRSNPTTSRNIDGAGCATRSSSYHGVDNSPICVCRGMYFFSVRSICAEGLDGIPTQLGGVNLDHTSA
jgi:hypothetical protein